MRTRTSPTSAGTVIQRSFTGSFSIGAAWSSSSTARASAGLSSYRNGGRAVASTRASGAASSTTGSCVVGRDMCDSFACCVVNRSTRRRAAPRPGGRAVLVIPARWAVAGPCDSRLEKGVDIVGEQLRILVQEPVAGVGVDPQLGVGEVLGEQVAVWRMHHRVVVAVGNE